VGCLAQLGSLTSLTLSNQFERAQVARLAKRLNHRLAVPLGPSVPTKIACSRCGGSKHMFTGRGIPFICPDCQRPRFERLTQEFADLVAAA
jgi:hypothetical protein